MYVLLQLINTISATTLSGDCKDLLLQIGREAICSAFGKTRTKASSAFGDLILDRTGRASGKTSISRYDMVQHIRPEDYQCACEDRGSVKRSSSGTWRQAIGCPDKEKDRNS